MSGGNRDSGKQPRRALGRGLDALLPVPAAPVAPTTSDGRILLMVPIEEIAPQKGQPRRRFDDESLDALAQSIREHGVLEPLLVRRSPSAAGTPESDSPREPYELIAGERRWRAAQRAGLREVPALVRDATPVE